MAINIPNPNETVWFLEFNGNSWDGSIVVGAALTLSSTLMNNGTFVPGFTSGSVLSAVVWPGNDLEATFNPTVIWDTGNGGYEDAVVLLTISDAQSAMLSEGNYRFQVFVTTSGVESLAFDGNILAKESVGLVAPTVPWCSLQDMLNESVQLANLYSPQNDASGFLNERLYVTQLTFRDIVTRYQPMAGGTRTRQAVPDPIIGFDVPDPTFDAITKTVLTTQLAATNGLILEARIRKIVACRTNALVLGRQVGNRVYMEDAAIQTAKADMSWRTYQAQVDLQDEPNGTPQALIDINCTFLGEQSP